MKERGRALEMSEKTSKTGRKALRGRNEDSRYIANQE